MDCLISVLKSIGAIFIGFGLICAAVAIIAWAGFATAKFFGWPEWSGVICTVAYFVVFAGTASGVEDCRLARKLNRIKAAR